MIIITYLTSNHQSPVSNKWYDLVHSILEVSIWNDHESVANSNVAIIDSLIPLSVRRIRIRDGSDIIIRKKVINGLWGNIVPYSANEWTTRSDQLLDIAIIAFLAVYILLIKILLNIAI